MWRRGMQPPFSFYMTWIIMIDGYALTQTKADNRTANEVRTLYGLQDPDIPAQRADEVVNSVFQLFKKSTNDVITKDEFVGLLESGGDLPDCEFDGHHGDEEWEVSSRVEES